MNKKPKPLDDREPPAWLVNLVIRLRVARWRLVERLNHWVARRKRPQLIASFAFLIIGGAAIYLNIFIWVLQPRREARMKELNDIYARKEPILESQYRWDTLNENPRFQRDGYFYWHLVDSLMADSNLRHSIDSLVEARPGLADTLHEVEQLHPRITK